VCSSDVLVAYLFLDDSIRYLFTVIGIPPAASGPYICIQKAITEIYIRRNNTDDRTHKIDSKTYKTRKQK
jgi:hypothetical protein